MDGGIIANTKVKTRKKYVQWLLDQMDGTAGDQSADKFKPDIRQAMMWIRDAWREVTKDTIVNCWRHVKILPTDVTACVPVVSETVLDELATLLLEFGKASGGDVCTVNDLIDIPAEQWTEAPESDDDECELTKALVDCQDPTGEDALDDDSVAPSMTLKEARAASRALQLFLEENKCAAEAEGQQGITAALSKLSVTSRHSQQALTSFFPAKSRPDPV